jgi:hypothetical protein
MNDEPAFLQAMRKSLQELEKDDWGEPTYDTEAQDVSKNRRHNPSI